MVKNAKTLAANGAAFLDAKYPGWYEEVNVERLDMERSMRCILGQLYNGYSNGLERLSISQGQAGAYGFDSESGTGSTYDNLRRAWIAEIDKRRNSVPRLATNAVADVTFEGTIKVGGKEIIIPNLPLDYVLKLIEVNK